MTSSQALIRFATEHEAAASLARKLAAAEIELEREAQRGGPEAVAAWACPNGTDEERASIAAHYRRLQQQAGGSTAA